MFVNSFPLEMQQLLFLIHVNIAGGTFILLPVFKTWRNKMLQRDSSLAGVQVTGVILTTL